MRPNPHQWNVAGHSGVVRVRYKIYGDRVDGTYLAVDTTHAHINMPAALMWARGLEERPASVRFDLPPGQGWRVATQLYPSEAPHTFTAPNLQYLLDSPVELSAFMLRTFATSDLASGRQRPTFRLALHHYGTEAEADRLAADTEKIVRQSHAIFGEYPEYDAGTYTFIADYLPYASGDGMEHRNSTILSSSGALRDARQRKRLLGTIAHEFFHCWNVERIRPRSLEPFDFERANMSGELWLAEGFTSYYDGVILHRAGLWSLEETLADLAQTINTVAFSSGRQVRSAEQMSQQAPFIDAARSVDRTNRSSTFISYYRWGAAIGLGLDLTLRERSGGAVTLDDFMRAMWRSHGKSGERVPGRVGRPYDIAEVRELLGEVAGDRAFADAFFERYIQGREVVDYAALLEQAGLVLRKRAPGRAYLGNVRLDFGEDGATLESLAPFGSPIYAAGLEQDDVLVSLDDDPITSTAQMTAFLESHRPGDRVTVVFRRRDGRRVQAALTLAEEPWLELVPDEQTGRSLGDAERAFREAWLGGAGR